MSRHTARARSGSDRTSLYDEITTKIIMELEAGHVPWVQPWGTAAAKAPLAMPGNASIRAKKVRYFEDPEMKGRILPPPGLTSPGSPSARGSAPPPRRADWGDAVITPSAATVEDPANAGIRREPELPEHEEVVAEPRKPVQEFEPLEDEPDDEVQRQRVMQRNFSAATRQAPLDRADDLGM